MDLKLHKAARAAGGVSVARLTADMAVVSTRKFDPATGEETDPSFEQFSIKELKEQLKTSKDHTTALEEFIKDCEESQIVGVVKK